ncbi:ABC transporter substrate-binding protein [Ignatzschineria sp. LJL83]
MKLGKTFLKAVGCSLILSTSFFAQADNISSNDKELTPIKFLINSDTFTGANLWFLMADELGYFKDAGFTVDYSMGAGAFTAAPRLAREKFDFAYGDINSNIEVAAKRPARAGVGVYMMFSGSPSSIVLSANSSIKTPKDLEGKQITAHKTDVGKQTFEQFAQATGIDLSTVTYSDEFGEWEIMFDKLDKGETDALFGYVSTTSQAVMTQGQKVEDRLKYLKYVDYVPYMYGSSIMASKNMIDNHPEQVSAFVGAINKAVIAVVDDPDAAIEVLMRKYPHWDETKKIAERQRYVNTIEIEMGNKESVYKDGVGGIDIERMQKSIDEAYSARNLPNKPELKQVFDVSFLPPLDERIRVLEAK